MAKKKETKVRKLTDQENSFIEDLVMGVDTLEAYRRYWINDYSAAKCRYEAKKILERPQVQARMQALILERQTDVLLDEKFVLDMLKKTAIDQFGTGTGVKALELLGKKLEMWTEKHIVDDTKSHRKQADEAWENHLKRKAEEEGANIVDFEQKDGTND